MSNFIEQTSRSRSERSEPLAAAVPRSAPIGMIFVIAAIAARLFPGVEAEEAGARRGARRGSRRCSRRSSRRRKKAANLDAYKAQLAEMEHSFGAMLRKLPNKTEVPNLLTDISQQGAGAGLDQKLFQPEPQINKDFYAELPIKMRLTGSFHAIGAFVSGIAALPRIVTLHDVEIAPAARTRYRSAAARRDRQDLSLSRRRRAGRRTAAAAAGRTAARP